MNFHLLDQHEAIGWDFDGTLWNHQRASLMWDYIKSHPEKKHYIVTFRSGWRNGKRWAEDGCWDDLIRCGSELTADHFVEIINMDDETFDLHGARISPGGIYLDVSDTYKEWKGLACSQNGITVLIDDNPDHTLSGCFLYGVCYVDPDNLTGIKNVDAAEEIR